MAHTLIFRQLFEPLSCTYTYVLGCAATKKAVIIDPVLETVERDSRVLSQLGLDPVYGLNTHVHADHVTGTGELKRRFPKMLSVLARSSDQFKADVFVDHLETINFGQKQLQVRCTPGHTAGCVTYVDHDSRRAFTGDALLIRGCGRTDFQGGSSRQLYRSIHEQIFSLADDFLLYPGHDYQGQTATSVQEERRFNPRLTQDEAHFVQVMRNLNLPYPHQIDKAVPANKVCGLYELMDEDLRNEVFGRKDRTPGS